MRPVISTPAFDSDFEKIVGALSEWYAETLRPIEVSDGFMASFKRARDSFRMLSPGKGRAHKTFWFEYKSRRYTVLYTYAGEAMILLRAAPSGSARAAGWLEEGRGAPASEG